MSECIHYIISNFADLTFACDIGIIVQHKEKTHQIADDSEMIYYMDE